jgi:hypothetical protein
MSDASAPRAEFLPNNREITLGRKLKRIDTECARRISEIYPLQEQINILVSMLADQFGFEPSAEIEGVSSEAYIFAKDRTRCAEYIRTLAAHRAAADRLKLYCGRNLDRLAAIDVSNSRHWPAPHKGKSIDEN